MKISTSIENYSMKIKIMIFFYNFGDFEESQDLEDLDVVLIIPCIYLIWFIFPKPKNILIQNFEN